MPLDPNVQPADAERTELEAVVEALARWPRLSQLLRYMGESFFSGKVDNLNEYNIATDVLVRSKTVFNAADDAIARVETHRLRKRLTEFYEKEGRDHQIQVTLPPGSYVPVFIHKPEGGPRSPTSADISSASQSEIQDKKRRHPVWLTQYWKYAISAASLGLVALGIFLYLH